MSLLSSQLYDRMPDYNKPVLRPSSCPLKAGNNTTFKTYGCALFKFTVQDRKFSGRFWVVDSVIHGIMGLDDFLEREKVDVDHGRARMIIRGYRLKYTINKVNLSTVK